MTDCFVDRVDDGMDEEIDGIAADFTMQMKEGTLPSKFKTSSKRYTMGLKWVCVLKYVFQMSSKRCDKHFINVLKIGFEYVLIV